MTEAGWYQDPSAPFNVRWWDGQGWTNHVRPAAGPGGSAPGGFVAQATGLDPASDLAEETKAGRVASLALIGGASAYSLRYVVNAFLLGPLWHAYRRWLDSGVQADGTRTRLVLPHSVGVLNLVSFPITIAVLTAGVFFLIWFEKAATVAMRAGLPARRSPGWAVVSFFIPIVSFWFPYQSAVDLFPLGHPGRQKVKRWWALWLATGFFGLAVLVASIGSTGAGLAMAVVAGAVASAAAWAGRAVIDEVDRVHAGLLGR